MSLPRDSNDRLRKDIVVRRGKISVVQFEVIENYLSEPQGKRATTATKSLLEYYFIQLQHFVEHIDVAYMDAAVHFQPSR